MNRFRRPELSAPFFIAVVSLIISSCAGGSTEATNASPPAEPVRLPDINVPNLHLLAPTGMAVGVSVPAGRAKHSVLKSVERRSIVNRHFSQITAENIMKPSYLHPRKRRFFFDDADALVDYAASQDKTVHGHALIWHYGLPNWMNNFEGDEAAWTTMMTNHISGIVSHFADDDVVVSWDVVNEAIADIDDDRDGLNDLRETICTKKSDLTILQQRIAPPTRPTRTRSCTTTITTSRACPRS